MEANEILMLARNMLKARTESLQNDVRRCCFGKCKDTQFAPFPALLYCFSTIDLLGSIYGGNAKSDTTSQSAKYMSEIMRYPKAKVYLIQQIFRHKIVHLAQPNPKSRIVESTFEEIKDNNLKAYLKGKIKSGLYHWGIEHRDRAKHLTIEPLGKEGEEEKFRFWVSIWSLVEDIVDSVYKPNGYLHRLEKEDKKEEELHKKFKSAYNQIFLDKLLT